MRWMKAALFLAALSLAVVATMAVVAEEAAQGGQEARPAMEGLTGGEQPWERAYDQAMLQGRDHYNAEARQEARDAFRRAIQVLPERPAAYRNLARNYNLMGQYREAVEYYDHYLRLAPDGSDREVILRERRGAATRSGDDPWREPADQRLARRALERELDQGRALTEGGGGAWGLYENLLATGYAAPELERLRSRVEQRLVAEIEEELQVVNGFLPVLTVDDWALQYERIQALRQLARGELALDYADRRGLLVEVVWALLDDAHDEALRVVDQVGPANDDLPFAGWYEVVALAGVGRPGEAVEVLDELVAAGVFAGDGRRQVEVVRAQLLQKQGRLDAATDAFEALLTGR